jgi:hypothetical protein
MKKIVTRKTHTGENTFYFDNVNGKDVLRKIVVDLTPWVTLSKGDKLTLGYTSRV